MWRETYFTCKEYDLKGEEIFMKPRIFISSTFYDLKYIREDLSNFIKAHDFEPILFEDGDIGYTPFTTLDDSCYKAIESADMALLIVGGSYGSPASGEKPSDFEEFISVTRREFQKGVENGVPFYVFIDRNVYAEYGIYDLNSKDIDSGACNIQFKATKNINVFRFIKEIYNIKQISVTEFNKSSDIKDFLSKQWSDMFKSYLSSMKEQKEIEQVQDSISHMNVLIEKMDKILDAVGKEVLKDSKAEYKQIIEENAKAEAKAICLLLSKVIKLETFKNIDRRDNVAILLKALEKLYTEQETLAKEKEYPVDCIPIDYANELITTFVDYIHNNGLLLQRVEFKIFDMYSQLQPFLKNTSRKKELSDCLCTPSYYHRIFKTFSKTIDDNETVCDK